MAPRTKTKTPVIDRIQVASDAYVSAIVSYIEAQKLPKAKTLGALLNRPQSVRVGKVASFTVSGVKLSDIFSTDDIYYITNKAYNQFKRYAEVDVVGITDDDLLQVLQGK